jgi:glycosyltransferase involved in cell wall biosynthesis
VARVLIIVQNPPAPFDRRAWLGWQALVATGHEVAVVCPRGQGDPARDAAVDAKLNDVRDYAAAIAGLLDDEPRRARLGKLGRACVEQELAWCRQEGLYVDVYRRLLDGNKALERIEG